MEPTRQEVITSTSRRPSLQTHDLDPTLKVVENRPHSLCSTGSRTAAYRHVLLKGGNPRGESSDLPVPPILTQINTIDTIVPNQTARDSHGEHLAVSKTRPASNMFYGGRSGISKVRSADSNPWEVQINASIVDSTDSNASAGRYGVSKVRSAEMYTLEQPQTSQAVWSADSNRPQDTMVGIKASTPTNAILTGHYKPEHHRQPGRRFYEPKVRTLLTGPSCRMDQPVFSTLAESEGIIEDSRATSYWGFLPGFKGKKQDGIPIKETSDESPANTRQELPLQLGLSDTKGRHTAIVGPRTRCEKALQAENCQTAPRYHVGERRNSTPSIRMNQQTTFPSHLPRTLTSQLLKDTDHRSVPEFTDSRRTAQWLRDLLKSKKPTVSNLTRLPEKYHPRRQPHHDYFGHGGSTAASRVTTFSDENAAEADAMEQAMHNLEQLLSEALEIANEVTSHDHVYIDDGHLQPNLLEPSQIGDSRPPSLHESLLQDFANEDERPTRLVGAMEGHGDGCETLPERFIERCGLAMSDMHNGNIRGPSRPPGASNLSRRKPTSKHKSVTHSVSSSLPMPPPDWQLRRDCGDGPRLAYKEDDPSKPIQPHSRAVPNSREVREYIRVFHLPPIMPRGSSKDLRGYTAIQDTRQFSDNHGIPTSRHRSNDCHSLDGGSNEIMEFSTLASWNKRGLIATKPNRLHNYVPEAALATTTGASHSHSKSRRIRDLRNISLRGRSHVSIRDAKFSLTKFHRSQPIARDWSSARKRFVAIVACFGTAVTGMLLGIYAGIVPAVQYYIADANHVTILGNAAMYLGMAVPTLFCWPLPLLHGRRQYILMGLVLAIPLLFPQAITVSTHRSSKTNAWKWALLLPRGFMGISLGFAHMNFHSTLTDLFGASLMSSNPHQEIVDDDDVRRHGGGLGVWLRIWTWCFIGSLGFGFLVGAIVIDRLPPAWGFYICIIILAIAVILNVLTPEVRRSAWRRSVAEVRTGDKVSRRVAKGEVMMHRVKDGPKWWGQEVWHGTALSFEMLRQPGFAVVAVYSAWVYAQVVLIIVVS